ncbi:MAG TPA: hypothetical protein VJ866_23850 [Pyrinomonadaceae bacterium]|nr:hypothetical protein [Pyrinomonadaceae bacterium]
MRTVGAVLLLLCAATAALADLKVTRKTGAGGHSSETTVYVKGSRQRTETPALTTIEQCDLRRTIQISERSHKYVIIPDQPAEGEATPAPAPTTPQTSRPTRRGGVVTHTVTITDTGERKQVFGFNARHIKSTTVMDAPQGTCNPGHFEIETDGWYIDAPAGFSCDVTRAPSPPPMRGGRPDCQDQVRTKLVGSARLGLPVSMTTRMKTGGEEDAEASAMAGAMTMTLEVTDISNVTLDPALFEIPAGYTEVASMQELFGAPSSADMMRQAVGGNRTEGGDEGTERGGMSTPSAMSNAAAAAVAPKRPGVVRVGVVPINNRSGREVSAESMSVQLVNGITGSGVEAVPLAASEQAAAEAEARQKECDFILYTELAALKPSAGKVGGMFGRAVGAVTGSERYESRVEFRLVPTAGDGTRIELNATAKQEGAEASVGAALDSEAKTVVAAVRKKK